MLFFKQFLSMLIMASTLSITTNLYSNPIVDEIIAHTKTIIQWGKDAACEIRDVYFERPADYTLCSKATPDFIKLRNGGAIAFYEMESKTITFCESFFEFSPSIQAFVVHHEMQHARQFKNLEKAFKFHPKLQQFIEQNRPYLKKIFADSLQIPLWTLYCQDYQSQDDTICIVEADADLTAAMATKCYICLEIVQTIIGHTYSKSYLNRNDYTPMVQELKAKNCLCSAHKGKKLDDLVAAIQSGDAMGVIAADKKVGKLIDRYSK